MLRYTSVTFVSSLLFFVFFIPGAGESVLEEEKRVNHDFDEWIQLYDEKLFTFAEIARRFNLSENTIKYHIKEKVTITSRSIYHHHGDYWIALYKSGETIRDIAFASSVSRWVVRRVLKERDVSKRL